MSQPHLKASADGDRSSEQPKKQSGTDVNADAQYVTVYTFVVYDHDKGTTIIYPRMATRQTIANMRGKVNEETAWVVNVADLDVMGFYSGEMKGSEAGGK